MPDGQITAQKLAKAHREISVAEFFEKNKHLLGYENLQKSLLTVVREAVDNALDACEEARILPTIFVEIEKLENDKFRIIVEDNGPGIVKKNIPKIFGKLLYGSKFHRLKQSRGQQGIGISAAVLYSQLTTGKPTKIYSRPGDGKTHIYEVTINTTTNDPEIHAEDTFEGEGTGVRIEMEIKGKYTKGKQGVYEYLQETAIMNPYAKIIFIEPSGEKFVFERGIGRLPVEPKEIKPHPNGIELGILLRMLKNSTARNIVGFLSSEFSRVSREKATEMCAEANIDYKISPANLSRDEAERLLNVMQTTKLQNPPTNCLSPLGKRAIEKGLTKELKPEFVIAITRSPAVYAGKPFQIEVGIAYGGNINPDGPIGIMRFANKVPLLYQQSACGLTKAIINAGWKRYGLQQSANSIPVGPAVVLVHIASVWVPYTSEGKESIAAYPEILKEVKLAIQDAARQLGRYISAKNREKMRAMKASLFMRYVPEIGAALSGLTGEA